MYAHFSIRRLIAAALVAAMLCLGLAWGGDPATAQVIHRTSVCGPPYQANGNQSLRQIAEFVALSPMSQILEDTVVCAPGQVYPPDVQLYINTSKSFNNAMIKGSRLWFSRLPAKG